MKQKTIIILLLLGNISFSQLPLLDQMINANGLLCFPVLGDSNKYVYLPKEVQFSLDKNQLPMFSFLRYVKEKQVDASSTISQADGGAILNFVIEYQTSEKEISDALKILQKETNNKNAFFASQVLFNSAQYTLISSIIDEDGGTKRKIIKTGKAPVFENSRMAFSFELSPEKSILLLNSMTMATPDISISFELEFQGVTSEYSGEINVSWDQLEKEFDNSIKGNYYMIGAEIDIKIAELIKKNYITITTTGTNQKMESLLEATYNKIVNLLFTPSTENEKKEESQSVSTEDKIMNQLKNSASKLKFISVQGRHRYKKIQNKGTAKINFSGRQTVSKIYTLVFNMGNIHTKYGNNKILFKTAQLKDISFNQRKIHLAIDGNIEQCYQLMLNGFTVKLKKEFPNKEATIKELYFSNSTSIEKIQNSYFNYLYLDVSESEEDWLTYQYQITYFFKGGKSYSSLWDTTNASLINIYPPFELRKIELLFKDGSMPGEKYKAISVKISYPFFGSTEHKEIVLREKAESENASISIITPIDFNDFNYEINYLSNNSNGDRKKINGKETSNIIFIE